MPTGQYPRNERGLPIKKSERHLYEQLSNGLWRRKVNGALEVSVSAKAEVRKPRLYIEAEYESVEDLMAAAHSLKEHMAVEGYVVHMHAADLPTTLKIV